MILDCHLHSWRYPTHFPGDVYVQFTGMRNQGLSAEEIGQRADRSAERLLREMEEAGVDKGLALGLKSEDTLGIEVPNEFLAEEVKPHQDKLYWACCVVMTEEGAADEVKRCVEDLGAVALSEIGPGYAHFAIDDPRCFPVYEVARSLDVPVSIHAGPVSPMNSRLKYGDLNALDEVCVSFPELKVILCYMGEPHYEQASHLLAKHPNLYADVSMMPYGAGLSRLTGTREPAMQYPLLHLDSPLLFYFSLPTRYTHKLMWASDVQNPKESMEGFLGVNGRLKEAGLPTIPEDAIERMFHENWQRVFPKIAG